LRTLVKTTIKLVISKWKRAVFVCCIEIFQLTKDDLILVDFYCSIFGNRSICVMKLRKCDLAMSTLMLFLINLGRYSRLNMWISEEGIYLSLAVSLVVGLLA
jgi:hypothetical protein